MNRTRTAQRRWQLAATAVVGAVIVGLPAQGIAQPATPRAAAGGTRQTLEVFSPDGTITRVHASLAAGTPMTGSELEDAADGVSALQVAGPSENRYDLVFLGDGYTAQEQELFHEHVQDKWDVIATTEPFTTYANFFNVWVVEVVSPESGVDNDPRPPTQRDTALDMEFWCSGVERGLCVDEAKARQMAALAPEADQIVVLANSTKYGGIGGSVATSSGGNAAAGLITVHELGHSLGGLADEYDYYLRAGLNEDAAQDVTIPAPYTVYPGAVLGEPGGVNITAEPDAAELVAQELKWWRWVGEESPDGGPVGTFEGGGYYRYGLYRPTQDSLMHTLGTPADPNPFNLPSREQMTAQFYETVRPLDGVAPADGTLTAAETASIDVVHPATHQLDIRWFLDGVEIPGTAGQSTFTIDGAAADRAAKLEVVVSDPTPFVRDPEVIADLLTQRFAWDV